MNLEGIDCRVACRPACTVATSVAAIARARSSYLFFGPSFSSAFIMENCREGLTLYFFSSFFSGEKTADAWWKFLFYFDFIVATKCCVVTQLDSLNKFLPPVF